jgi:predicted acyltransferase
MKMKRVLSLDALRGLDMWFITGGDAFLKALGIWLTGSKDNFLVTQMTHVPWIGLRVYDLIFPLFLFIAGISWPFSLASRRAKGATDRAIVLHIFTRTLSLIVIGLFISRILRFDWERFRVWSVIGRVGIAWGVAALIFTFCSLRTSVIITVSVLIGWWVFILAVPSPDAPAGVNPMSDGAYCIGSWVDTHYLTTAHRREGGLATLAMPPLVLMGMFVGAYLRQAHGKLSGGRICLTLAGAGAAAIVIGLIGAFCLGPFSLPIVKNVYSSTYSLIACGIGAILFAILYWIIDVKGYVAWSLYFRVIGANALAIYFGQCFLNFPAMAKWFLGNVPGLFSPEAGAVLVAVTALALRWIPLHFLYKRNIYIKV